MSKFTHSELQDLIDGGNEFTQQLAIQCLRAERKLEAAEGKLEAIEIADVVGRIEAIIKESK